VTATVVEAGEAALTVFASCMVGAGAGRESRGVRWEVAGTTVLSGFIGLIPVSLRALNVLAGRAYMPEKCFRPAREILSKFSAMWPRTSLPWSKSVRLDHVKPIGIWVLAFGTWIVSFASAT